MATVLYKKENGKVKACRVDPHHIEGYLKIGWKLEDPRKKVPQTVEQAEKVKETEVKIQSGQENVNPADVRALAKEKGLKDWDTKRIQTLIGELGGNN